MRGSTGLVEFKAFGATGLSWTVLGSVLVVVLVAAEFGGSRATSWWLQFGSVGRNRFTQGVTGLEWVSVVDFNCVGFRVFGV